MTVADSRIDELRRRLERDPASRLFAQLAEEHRKAGDLGEAIRVSRAGLAQHPSYPSARLTLGRALLESGDPAGARGELEAALRDAPDNILASRFLAEALEALGNLGSALEQYRATLKVAPGDRHVEGRIRGIEMRLRGPGPPAASAGTPRGGDVTSPLRGRAAQVPARPTAAPPAVTRERGDSLPITIRLHAPVNLAGAEPPAAGQPRPTPPPVERAPVPPQLKATARMPPPPEPSVETTSPFPPPVPEPTLPPVVVGPADDTDEAPTLPAAQARELETPPSAAAAAKTVEGGEPAHPLSSSTLAELYFGQGLVDRAIEVYGRLLQEDPGNERARVRLKELQGLAAGTGGVATGAARRRALERTIAALEKLLSVVRRR